MGTTHFCTFVDILWTSCAHLTPNYFSNIDSWGGIYQIKRYCFIIRIIIFFLPLQSKYFHKSFYVTRPGFMIFRCINLLPCSALLICSEPKLSWQFETMHGTHSWTWSTMCPFSLLYVHRTKGISWENERLLGGVLISAASSFNCCFKDHP